MYQLHEVFVPKTRALKSNRKLYLHLHGLLTAQKNEHTELSLMQFLGMEILSSQYRKRGHWTPDSLSKTHGVSARELKQTRILSTVEVFASTSQRKNHTMVQHLAFRPKVGYALREVSSLTCWSARLRRSRYGETSREDSLR